LKNLIWLVPLMPFLGAFLNGVALRNRLSKRGVNNVACGSVLLSLLIGMAAIGSYLGSAEYAAGEGFRKVLYGWIPAGLQVLTGGEAVDLVFEMGFLLDPLSSVMVFVVTFVGFWIHVYSVGYMSHESGYQRYFVYLNLFMGAMLLLVLGSNYLVTFVGWEGVGLCSYLLIGFYYDPARRSSSTGSVISPFWSACSRWSRVSARSTTRRSSRRWRTPPRRWASRTCWA